VRFKIYQNRSHFRLGRVVCFLLPFDSQDTLLTKFTNDNTTTCPSTLSFPKTSSHCWTNAK
jgi:hypothetical protein